MAAWRTNIVLAFLALPTVGFGQTYNLTDAPKTGECFRYAVETNVTGTMKATQDLREIDIKLNARNSHEILERVLSADKGVVRKSARYYERAVCDATVGEEKSSRTLRDGYKLIVAQNINDNQLCYSPAGPMTRSEVEVVSEHFDTLHLTGLLPGKETAIGESWKITNASAQAICLFEGLIEHDLTGKLVEVKDGQAIIAVEGKASGIELGASVKLQIKAIAHFDILKSRLVSLDWKQKDSRDQGPASPASEVESITTVKRTVLSEEPSQLSKTALVGVPVEDDPQELLKLLQHKDGKNRYSMLYSRDWQIVGRTDNHLVMRLLDRGDFLSQATITAWTKEAPGKHISTDDFKKKVMENSNWDAEEIVDAGEVPSDDGRWCYRVTAKGELDGNKVVQSFFVLASAQGEQIVVTFTMKPGNANKIGTKDLALVNAIEFPKK